MQAFKPWIPILLFNRYVMYTSFELNNLFIKGKTPNPSKVNRQDLLNIFNACIDDEILHLSRKPLLECIVDVYPEILTPIHLIEQKQYYGRQSTPIHTLTRVAPSLIPPAIITPELKTLQNNSGNTPAHLFNLRRPEHIKHIGKFCSIESLRIQNGARFLPIQEWGRQIPLGNILKIIPTSLIELSTLLTCQNPNLSALEYELITSNRTIGEITPTRWVQLSKKDNDLTQIIQDLKITHPKELQLLSNLEKAVEIKKDFQIAKQKLSETMNVIPTHQK
jgi:hypothetical protein